MVNKYIPKIVIEEVIDIKQEHQIKQDAEAFRKMADYSQLGRELERIMTFKFNHKPRKGRKLF